MLVVTEQDVALLLEFINENEILAYDTETSGLNVRKDIIVGFGTSNEKHGFYVPCYRWCANLQQLIPYGPGAEFTKKVLAALNRKKLLTWNASFDVRITKSNFGISLLPALYADVMLLKHTCDEEPPFALKEVGAMLYGQNVKQEQKDMQASIKANGGTAKQCYKADTAILAKYCIADCLLTYKLFLHYDKLLGD